MICFQDWMKTSFIIFFSISLISIFTVTLPLSANADAVSDQRAGSLVIEDLKNPDPSVRLYAIDWLGKSRNKANVKPFIMMLSDPYEKVRAKAAEALGELEDKAAVQPLIVVLKDPDWSLRSCAARALGKLGDKAAVQPLIAALKDPDNLVRAGAAEALGELRDKAAVQPLMEALKDSKYDVQHAAAAALRTLGIEVYGYGFYPIDNEPRPARIPGDRYLIASKPLNITWNIWAEEGDVPKFIPATHLIPDNINSYTINIHLSSRLYENKRVIEQIVNDKLKEVINEKLSKYEDKLTLNIILIPDFDHFYPSKNLSKNMEINLNKIRNDITGGNSFEILKSGLAQNKPLPDFVFGHISFEGIRTREKEGTG